MVCIQAERLEDGLWFITSPQAPGCWADGKTREEAEDEFCVVFREWFALKAQNGDDDLPPSDVTTNTITGG